MDAMQGELVDRPAVSFHELNGLDEDWNDFRPVRINTDCPLHRIVLVALIELMIMQCKIFGKGRRE